jgi:hypothetical protein
MRRKLDDRAIEAVLLMVKESADELKVHDADFFEEYEESLRKTRTILPSEAKSGGYSSPFAYTDILLGVGLIFLGQTAAALYEYVVQKGVEVGLKRLSARASSQDETSALLDDASKHILLTLRLPKEMDEAHLKQILTPQLMALMKLSGADWKATSDDKNG